MYMLKIAFVVLVIFIAAGFMFVQWANRPENVDALLKAREQKKIQAKADSLQAEIAEKQKKAEEASAFRREEEVQRKTEADLKLVVDETFKGNVLKYLDLSKNAGGKLEDNSLVFSAITYRKTSTEHILALTKQEYDHFAAEMEMEIWGDELIVGIVFNYKEGRTKSLIGELDTWKADRIGSGLQRVRLRLNNDDEQKSLVSLKEALTFKSIPKQKIRLEKKGKHLKMSVNGQVKFDKTVKEYSALNGKMGVYVAVTNSSDWNGSVLANIKSFKVWTW